MSITKETAEAFLKEFYDARDKAYLRQMDPEEFWDNYFTNDAIQIRPSGNPLDRDTFIAMGKNEDVKVSSLGLGSIDSVRIIAGGKVAIATTTSDEIFTYKGTPNEDRAKRSLVMELMDDGSIKVVHYHRCTGQPIPKDE